MRILQTIVALVAVFAAVTLSQTVTYGYHSVRQVLYGILFAVCAFGVLAVMLLPKYSMSLSTSLSSGMATSLSSGLATGLDCVSSPSPSRLPSPPSMGVSPVPWLSLLMVVNLGGLSVMWSFCPVPLMDVTLSALALMPLLLVVVFQAYRSVGVIPTLCFRS